MGKLSGIIIDCADAKRAATFWTQALEGYTIDEQDWGITLRSESDPPIFFEVVPEGKTDSRPRVSTVRASISAVLRLDLVQWRSTRYACETQNSFPSTSRMFVQV